MLHVSFNSGAPLDQVGAEGHLQCSVDRQVEKRVPELDYLVEPFHDRHNCIY